MGGACFEESAMPPPQTGRPKAPQFWGFLLFIGCTLCHRTTRLFWHSNTCQWQECILGSDTPPIPIEWSSSTTHGLFLYLCLHLLMQNDQISNGTGST